MRPKLLSTAAAAAVTMLLGAGTAAAQTRTTLDIYVIDVEGGNATLFVTPSGESVLIDTGNVGAGAVRDAERIVAAAKDARLTQIDHLITTHWHGDHFGGMAEVAKRIPIKHYIDHGPTVQPQPASDEFLGKVYQTLYGAARRTIAKPGDKIPVTGLDWQIVASGGETIKSNLAGAGAPNALCANHKAKDPDPSENAQSVASIITFGKFRVAHLGDLTWNKEFELACPMNRVGNVDLFVVTHHGQPISNPEVLVHGMRPRVAIMNNGTRKGGQPDAMKVLYSSPGLEDIWQIHFSLLSGQEYTRPGMFIANLPDEAPTAMPVQPMAQPAAGPQTPPPPAHDGPAFWIKASAQQDGTVTVTNQRNGFSKTYAAKP
jgi:competence protein ComEC